MNKIYSFLRDALLVSLVIIAFIFLPHVILHMSEYVKPELLFLYVGNARIDAVLIIASVGILALTLLSIHYQFRYRMWLISVPFIFSFWAVFYDDNRHWNLIYNLVVYLFLCSAFIAFALCCRARKLPLRESNGKYQVRFGRLGVYEAGFDRIIRLSKNANQGRSIAVFGSWGSGKTHFLRYIDIEMQKSNSLKLKNLDKSKNHSQSQSAQYAVKKIDLWQYHDIEDAWKSIIAGLYETICDKKPSPILSVGQRVLTLLSKAEISVLGISGALETLVNNRNDDRLKASADKLSACINFPEKVAVLILDDVERADIGIIEALLPLLERLQKIRGLIVVCAIARDELEEKFRENGKSSLLIQGYIDKLFDQSIYLPPIPDFYSAIEFKNRVDETAGNCRLLQDFSRKFIIAFDTPRQIMRVVERLAAIEQDYFIVREDGNVNSDCVFIVEILRLLYPAFLNDSKFVFSIKKLANNKSHKKKLNVKNELVEGNYVELQNSISAKLNVFEEQIKSSGYGGKLLPSLCELIQKLAVNYHEDFLKAYYMSYSKNISLSDDALRQMVNSVAHAGVYATLDAYIYSYCSTKATIDNYDDAIERMLKIILSRANEDALYEKLLKAVVELEVNKKSTESRNRLIFRKEFILDLVSARLLVRTTPTQRFYFFILGTVTRNIRSWKDLYATALELMQYEYKKSDTLTGRWYKLNEEYRDKMLLMQLNVVFYPIFARRVIKEYETASRASLSRDEYIRELRFFERFGDILPTNTYLNAYEKAHQGNLDMILKNYFKFLLHDKCVLYKNTFNLINVMFFSDKATEKWCSMSENKRRQLLNELHKLSDDIRLSHIGEYEMISDKLDEILEYIELKPYQKRYLPRKVMKKSRIKEG